MKQNKFINFILIILIFFLFKENVYAYYFLDKCSDVLDQELLDFLDMIFDYIKVLVPIYLIVLGAIDFGRAVMAGSEKDIQQVQSTFSKRLIAAIFVYFVPTLLNIILDLAGIIKDGTCGIG
ncbi:MAG: hypothetical protein ACOXZS_01660 [Bacilli bacterium]|jgi:hypothetical protein